MEPSMTEPQGITHPGREGPMAEGQRSRKGTMVSGDEKPFAFQRAGAASLRDFAGLSSDGWQQ